MRVWIPKCGDAVRLEQAWTFELHREYRNTELWDLLKYPDQGKRTDEVGCTLPAGTHLVFDRVYIRQGADAFASVTFIIKHHIDDKMVGVRFWAKLDDVNTMYAELAGCNNPVGGFAKAKYRGDLAATRDPKVKAKQEAAKASRQELLYVRDAVERAASSPANRTHLDNMLDDIVDVLERDSRRRGSHFFDRDRTRMYARFRATGQGYRRTSDPPVWVVTKTVKQDDGTTLRQLHYSDNRVPKGSVGYGWSVTTRDGDVIDIKPLLPEA